MDPAIDPFQPLLRLVDRYKRDVNVLNPGASEDAIRAAERHLGHRLPLTLAGFQRRWNGCTLFRGALRVRATSELAPPTEELAGLIAFADLGDGRVFAYAPDGQGEFLFGELVEGRLVALHDRFDRWLKGTIHLFDEDLLGGPDALDGRLLCDPQSGHLLLLKGEEEIRRGTPSRATRYLRSASAHDPGNIRAWQRLGEILVAEGEAHEGRFCLVKALRASRLPSPYVGAWVLEPDALRALASLFPAGDPAWQRELESLLGERVTDVRGPEDLALYEAGNLALVRFHRGQGDQSAARNVLVQGLERARGFQHTGPLTALVLQLAELELHSGRHDEAERSLRGLVHARHPAALLLLARIVVARQEPWSDQIVAEARSAAKTASQRAQGAIIDAERLLIYDRLEEAEAALIQADADAVAAADKALEGQICLGLGDVARLRGDAAGARAAYDAADARAKEASDVELSLRVSLRRGDLLEREGQRGPALDLYRQVAVGFARLGLPLREAWVCLRLARLGVEPALGRARELFGQSGVDFTAGVAACDAVAGTPGAALDWHLEQAAHHARKRAEAQRARPPLGRADADCPERRLGAHRMAVGAAPLGIVPVLEQRLTLLARDLESAAARVTDPKVVSYVAAVDLLAFHRSYEAAQVLLRQLMDRRLPELPAMALRGALARSPNAALVDGLMETVEAPGGEPGAVAAAAEVLGWRRELAAGTALRALLVPEHSFVVRRAAVQALGRIGDREAVGDLMGVLEVPQLEEAVAISLLLLGDRRGIDFHGQALAAGSELATPPGEIVGRYGGPSYLLLLMGTSAGSGQAALAAMQGLGYLGDVRAVPRLLENLAHRDRSRVAVACAAMELITGHREDWEEPGVGLRWERWWEERCSGMQAGVRYRYGEPLDPALLALTLGHDDAGIRRGAYDELVITTGCHLPFDADGPWRVQRAHQRAWQVWAVENRERFQAGGWWFDGHTVG